MALCTVDSDSDTNLDQNATTWTIFEAKSSPEEPRRHQPVLSPSTNQNRGRTTQKTLSNLSKKRSLFVQVINTTAEKMSSHRHLWPNCAEKHPSRAEVRHARASRSQSKQRLQSSS